MEWVRGGAEDASTIAWGSSSNRRNGRKDAVETRSRYRYVLVGDSPGFAVGSRVECGARSTEHWSGVGPSVLGRLDRGSVERNPVLCSFRNKRDPRPRNRPMAWVA